MAYGLNKFRFIGLVLPLFLLGCNNENYTRNEPVTFDTLNITSDNFIDTIKKEIIDKDPANTDAFEAYRTGPWSWNFTPLCTKLQGKLSGDETLLDIVKKTIPFSSDVSRPEGGIDNLSPKEKDIIKEHLDDYNNDYVAYYSKTFVHKLIPPSIYETRFIYSIETGTKVENIECFLFDSRV